MESICIIYVYVDYYANILDYLLGVPSIAQINPIFLWNNKVYDMTVLSSEIYILAINLYYLYGYNSHFGYIFFPVHHGQCNVASQVNDASAAYNENQTIANQ